MSAPSAAPFSLPFETRPARERRVTSRTKWRRDLPQPAANDNDPPISRPAPARRALTLEAMLAWAYRQQQAHRIIRGAVDKFLWAADQADLLTNPADRRQLHVDALIVHEAVQALGVETAAMVIAAALFGDWPQWMDEEECRPYPMPPSDRYDDHGWYIDAEGRRAEYLIKTEETVAIEREEYEQVGRKKMRRAGADSLERVPVRYGVIRWEPEPAFIEANNRTVAQWHAARPVLVAALRDAPFKDHVLAEEVANDNEPVVANDNEPIQEKRTA